MTQIYDDIKSFLIDFGNSVPASVTVNEDGSYSIFLNARISHEKRLQAYQHELRHILNHDFETANINVNDIELTAHHNKL